MNHMLKVVLHSAVALRAEHTGMGVATFRRSRRDRQRKP